MCKFRDEPTGKSALTKSDEKVYTDTHVIIQKQRGDKDASAKIHTTRMISPCI